MAGMHVPLEPEELHKLIELAYLGEWVINAHHDPEHQDESAATVMQRLLEAAKIPGVGRDLETGEYFLPENWTTHLYDDHIADYDDHVFWDELTERLAQRDLAHRRGVSPDDINRDDDIAELRPLEERYRRAFEERGVERLELSEDF
jgi:hypothetical protein